MEAEGAGPLNEPHQENGAECVHHISAQQGAKYVRSSRLGLRTGRCTEKRSCGALAANAAQSPVSRRKGRGRSLWTGGRSSTGRKARCIRCSIRPGSCPRTTSPSKSRRSRWWWSRWTTRRPGGNSSMMSCTSSCGGGRPQITQWWTISASRLERGRLCAAFRLQVRPC